MFAQQEFLRTSAKETSAMKTFNSIKNHFKNFRYCIKKWLCADIFFEATINLAPMVSLLTFA